MPSAADPGLLTELTGAWAAGLLDASVKGTVLLLGALVASRLLRSRPAAARHLVWAAALAGMLCLPVLSGFLPRVEIPGLPRIAMDAGDGVAAVAAPAGPEASTVGGEAVAPTPGAAGAGAPASAVGPSAVGPTGPLAFLGRIPPASAAAGLWLLGVLAVLAHAAIGRVRVWWLARSATPVHDGPWARTRTRLARRLGLRRRVTLLSGPESTVPMTWGVLRPRILLPDEAAVWTERCRRNVLLHELAHVRRGDYLMRLAGRLAVAVYWFHPLAWLALRRLRREQEEACDDYVLRSGVRPSEYAGQLVRLARSLRTVGSGAHAGSSDDGPSEFLRRMRSLLRADRPRQRVPGGQLAALGTGAALLVAALAALGPARADGGAAGPAAAGRTAAALSGPPAMPAPGDDQGRGGGAPAEAEAPTGPQTPASDTTAGAADGPPDPDAAVGGVEAAAGGAAAAAGGRGDVARRTALAGEATPDAPSEPSAAGRSGDGPAGPEARPGAGAALEAGPELVPEDLVGLSMRSGSLLAAARRSPSGSGSQDVEPGGRPAGLEPAGRAGRDAGVEEDAGAADDGGRGADGTCTDACSVGEVLARLAERPDSTARFELLRGMARSASGRSAAVLMELSYRARRPADRRMVVQALAEVPGPAGERYLYQVARANPWVSVRAAAIDELGRSDDERVVPWLVNLAYHDVSPEIQKFAVTVLARLDRTGAESGLVQIARSHPEDQVRHEAVVWLLRTGRGDVLGQLVESV